MRNFLLFTIPVILSACASLTDKKFILDTSGPTPSWVKDSKVVWQDGSKTFIKSQYTVNGTERVNGCYTLAKLGLEETLATEILAEVKGTIDASEVSLSNDSGIILAKSRSSEYQGSIKGLRVKEQYDERYRVGSNLEKQRCYVLASIDKQDYLRTKQSIVNKISEAAPEIKEAIIKKQLNFFNTKKTK